MRNSIIVLAAIALSGCVTTRQYSNPSISDPGASGRQFAIDHGACTQAAISSAPVPAIPQEQPQLEYRSIDGDKVILQSSPSFSQGFTAGRNVRTARQAERAQDAIYHGCMVSKGWVENP